VTRTGASISIARRASRAASSSRQPPLISPIGRPLAGTSSRAPGRRYEEPRTDTTVASAIGSPRAARSAAASRRSSVSLTHRCYPAVEVAYHRRMTPFLDALRTELPDLRVLTDEIDRESFRHDETAHHEPG